MKKQLERRGRNYLVRFLIGLAMAVPVGSARAQTPGDGFASLVAAENAFAADALRDGITPAFKAHAASDSVLLRPEPVAAATLLAAQSDAPGVTLEWRPSVAGIARSGDLGFTSGPYRLVEGGHARMGQFLTIWSRGADGRWRWFLDHGLPPAAEDHGMQLPSQVMRFAEGAAAGAAGSDPATFEAMEDRLNAGYLDKGVAAVLPQMAEEGFLLRPGRPPITKRDAAGLAASPRRFAGATRLGMRMSAAGDIAVTYGRLTRPEGPAAYYVRIWRRNGTDWQLLIDELV